MSVRVDGKIVQLPVTPEGRKMLRETLATLQPESRFYVASLFDWDEEADGEVCPRAGGAA